MRFVRYLLLISLQVQIEGEDFKFKQTFNLMGCTQLSTNTVLTYLRNTIILFTRKAVLEYCK